MLGKATSESLDTKIVTLLGLLLFLIYTLPSADIVIKHELSYPFYIDDTQLDISFKPGHPQANGNIRFKPGHPQAVFLLFGTPRQLANTNLSSFNTDVTVFLLIGTPRQLANTNLSSFNTDVTVFLLFGTPRQLANTNLSSFNTDVTLFLLFGTPRQLANTNLSSFNVAGDL